MFLSGTRYCIIMECRRVVKEFLHVDYFLTHSTSFLPLSLI